MDDLNKNRKKNPTEKLGQKYFELIETADLTEQQKTAARQELTAVITAVKRGEIDSFRMKIKGVHKMAYGGQPGGRNNQIKNQGFTIIRILGNKIKKDLIESPVESTKDNQHPAVYPLYIIQELIKLLSQSGDLVLDPFCGSGTTCLAARNLHRRYFGIDINSEYVQLSQTRLQNEPLQEELLF